MKINLLCKNPALVSLFENPAQTIFLDTNFLIPPDRSKVGARPIALQKYCEIWLEPIFDAFSNLSIHESVYQELVADHAKKYIDNKCRASPPKLVIYSNSILSPLEAALMQTYIKQIAPFSKYIPMLENSDDKGEVSSLAFMATKGFLYFASNDNLPIQLIRKAEDLGTGLQHMRLLEMFDIIFYLYKMGTYDNKGLRLLYKYQYHLTKREKAQNPEWNNFIKKMDLLYSEYSAYPPHTRTTSVFSNTASP